MKAAVLYKDDDIRCEDFPEPKTETGTVKVKVKAAGICGSDLPRVFNGGAHYYPIVLGHEFAGEVVEIGEGTDGFNIGDTVTGAPLVPCLTCVDCQQGNHALCKHYTFIGSRIQGSFAEYVVLPARNAVKYDPSVSFEQAAMFEPSTVAVHGLFCVNYSGGEDVAVLGGGTIGLFTMQWAKIFGARSVTVFDIDDERLELAKRLGADYTVNSMNEKSPNSGYGYVFETAGATAAMHTAFEIAGNKAKVCFIGTPHTDLKFTPRLWENMNRKEFMLTGSWMSYSSPFPGKEWELTAHCFATGQLKFDKALIYKTFPLSRAQDAFQLFKNPSRVKGKVMLTN